VSADHYSLEEEKQKAEADRMAMTAEEKKSIVRRQIQGLRKDFEKLLAENKALPDGETLSRVDFEMDPEIAKRFARHEESRRARYTAEMAWTLERHTVAHEKLRTRFLERVSQPMFVSRPPLHSSATPCTHATRISLFVTNRIGYPLSVPMWVHSCSPTPPTFQIVKCIRSNEMVSTYRLIEPSSAFLTISDTLMTSMVDLKMQSLRTKKNHAKLQQDKERNDAQQKLTNALYTSAADYQALQDKEKAGKLSREDQQQLRKIKRQIRKKEWGQFISSKPDPEKVAPEDEEAVEFARTHMGDYKLKTSRDYVVPPEERINTEIKREQIVALRRRIYDAKVQQQFSPSYFRHLFYSVCPSHKRVTESLPRQQSFIILLTAQCFPFSGCVQHVLQRSA
jgi:hypothetical protein